MNHFKLFFGFVSCMGFIYSQSWAQNDTNCVFDMSIEELLNVEVIVASKIPESIMNAPGLITVLTKKEIETYGGNNLGELLNKLTSIYMVQGGILPYNIASIRGQTQGTFDNHTLILLNGRPVRDGISGGMNGAIYTSFPIQVIEQIELIRGPGSALYGTNAFAGVINIVTRQQDEVNILKASTSIGSFGYANPTVCASFNKKNIATVIAANYIYETGPEYTFYDAKQIENTKNFSTKGHSFFLNSHSNTMNLNVLYASYSPFTMGKGMLWENSGNEMDASNHLTVDLEYKKNWNKWANTTLNITYNQHAWVPDKSESYNLITELTYQAQPIKNLNILAASVNCINAFNGSDLIEDSKFCTKLYTQADYILFDKFKLISGFQINNIGLETQNLSPRFGLIYFITKKLGLKYLDSYAYRSPFPNETNFRRDNIIGNPDLLPETARTLEGQLFYQSKNIQASASVYHSQMKDLIVKTKYPLQQYATFSNAGIEKFLGTEYEIKYQFLENWSIHASLLYQVNKNDTGLQNTTFTPNIIAKAGIMYTKKTFSMGLFNAYFGEPTQVNDLLPVNKQITPLNPEAKAYNLMSFKISYNFSNALHRMGVNQMQISAYANNLLNAASWYPDIASYKINSIPLYAPAGYYVKLSIVF